MFRNRGKGLWTMGAQGRRALLALLALVWLICVPAPSQACFGPKLYIGAPGTAQGELLFELVALYVKEKTGTESIRVVLEGGTDPLGAIRGEKVDLAFAGHASGPEPALLQVAGLPLLVSGKRPLEDLQFTTVGPALRKLNTLLQAAEIEALVGQVAQGAPPAAAARKFLMAKRWI